MTEKKGGVSWKRKTDKASVKRNQKESCSYLKPAFAQRGLWGTNERVYQKVEREKRSKRGKNSPLQKKVGSIVVGGKYRPYVRKRSAENEKPAWEKKNVGGEFGGPLGTWVP